MSGPSTPAGWYPDPSGDPGQRWWDGSQWTDQVQQPQPGTAWSRAGGSGAPYNPGVPYLVTDQSTGETHFLTLASFWTRFGGYLIDDLVLVVPQLIFRAVAGAVISDLLSVLIGLAYSVILIGGPQGQTIGDRAMGLRVVSADDGGSIGYGRATVRYFVGLLSGLVLGLGYLWMLWDPRRQTWHDKAANSVVVKLTSQP
jgi:uncharacterized RDD family membrane protein YckC